MKTINNVSYLNKLLIALLSISLTACLPQEVPEETDNTDIDFDYDDVDEQTNLSTMNYSRSGHTATLLDDGKVLVTGGHIVPVPTTEYSEIYDPTTNTWSLGPSPIVSRRANAKAIKLNDGKVMIVAGTAKSNGSSISNEVMEIEIYDPSSNSFSVVATLDHSRHGGSATLLNDGRVLLAGGLDYNPANSQTTYFKDAEIFDPSTNQLTPTLHDMNIVRSGHSAIKHPSGPVLFFGGLVTLPYYLNQMSLTYQAKCLSKIIHSHYQLQDTILILSYYPMMIS